MRRDDYLFRSLDAFSVQRNQQAQMQAEIAGMDGNRLLNTNVDDLVAYFAGKCGIEVPDLLEDQMVIDQREAQRDVSGDPMRRFYYDQHSGPILVTGNEISLEVSFEGDPQMFRVQPNTYNMNPPRGVVHNNSLTFTIWGDNLTSDQVRSQIDEWLQSIRQHLQWQRDSFRAFSEALPREARQAIEQRREQLLRNQNLVASLGIPLKRRPDPTMTYTAPEVKRKLTPKLPPATAGAFKPEPIMEEAEYQHILGIMESMAHVLERSPKAFYDLDEEGVRTHFLVQLNGHYEGQATGETFNYQGKTDILVRSGDRNIFIAECKFWGGPAKLTGTIEQLLGYVSWRDSKTSILLFNRNRDFSRVLSAIPETVMAHPNFQRAEGTRGETGFRYRFRHKDDPAKLLHLTILAFDMPVAPAAT
jgi:hypothetical protein